jgi:hypothetical protein
MSYPLTGNVSLGSVTGNIKLYVNEGGVNNLTGIGYNNNSMTFGVNQSVFAIPEMVINQSGNVGIGTTNPIYTLDISGNVRSSDLRIDNTKIHLGQNAGLTSQGANCVAIGYSAGETSQGQSSIAIGDYAGFSGLGIRSIAIGTNSDGTGGNSIAIGHGASTSTFGNSVAIGAGATCTVGNTIVLGTASQSVIIPRNIRYLSSPMFAYTFSTTAQLVATNVDRTIIWTLADPRNGLYTGITYSSGVFTNSNSYSITVSVSASASFSPYAAGFRVLFIVTSGQGRLGMTDVTCNTSDPTVLSTSSTFVLNTTETFIIQVFHNAGVNLMVGESIGTYTTRVSILVM